ncbi:MAG: cAMP-binding protein [Hyphomicrobiales bacterium]|nr:cAMP-binding protein [Hyphomicrobiales bacterium]
MSAVQTTNGVLQRVLPDDYKLIEPFINRVELKLKQELIVPDVPISHVWFFESGMCSMIARSEGSEAIEVGMVGFEGMTDHLTRIGDTSALRSVMQLPGTALAIEAARYLEWINERPNVLRLVLRYQQSMMVQIAFTALAHGSYTIEERLARWLLMSFDRSHDADLPLVHEFIAMMLAVRRSGVTTAMHILEGKHAIRAVRGRIQLRDRQALEELAAGSYGLAEREYARLMGPIEDKL